MHIRFFPAVKEIDIMMADKMTVVIVILPYILGYRYPQNDS